VHGANRLGGNSLLETVVFGRRAGAHAAQLVTEYTDIDPNWASDSIDRTRERIDRHFRAKGERADVIRTELATSMYDNCGVFRTESEMVETRDLITTLRERYDGGVEVQDKGQVFNTDLTYALEVGALLEMADVLTRCAIERKESRGGHSRTDYPERDDENWLVHSYTTRTPDDPTIHVGTHPVTLGKYQPAVRSY
jgi:succinate dehydrogenase / fumarate reductase flavoprotein subunit